MLLAGVRSWAKRASATPCEGSDSQTSAASQMAEGSSVGVWASFLDVLHTSEGCFYTSSNSRTVAGANTLQINRFGTFLTYVWTAGQRLVCHPQTLWSSRRSKHVPNHRMRYVSDVHPSPPRASLLDELSSASRTLAASALGLNTLRPCVRIHNSSLLHRVA